MDSTEAKVRVEGLNTQLDEATQALEKAMRRLERGSKVSYDRPPDFGRRRFDIQVLLDDFNVEELDAVVVLIKEKMTQYRTIRQELSKLRVFLSVEEAVKKSTYDGSTMDLNFGGR